jgi:hypothetical protein
MVERLSKNVAVTIRIDPSQADRLDQIVDTLKKEGLASVEVHRRFMIINGQISVDHIQAIGAVAGVMSVRLDQTYEARPE